MPSSPQKPSAPLDFSQRAHLSEWMDEPCSYEEFRDCLVDLAQVNRLTMTHRPTLAWLQELASTQKPNETLHIVDVGCGGGDLLRRVERWAMRQNISVRLTGVDLNPFAARAAREFTPAASEIAWITGDAFSLQTDQPIDCIVSSLFTHHLPDAEIVRFLAWMENTAQRGWFVNDLSRAPAPYYAFGALAWAMRWHRFVRHDGPISVRRAFSESDWKHSIAEAKLDCSTIKLEAWRPARLCVSRVKL